MLKRDDQNVKEFVAKMKTQGCRCRKQRWRRPRVLCPRRRLKHLHFHNRGRCRRRMVSQVHHHLPLDHCLPLDHLLTLDHDLPLVVQEHHHLNPEEKEEICIHWFSL